MSKYCEWCFAEYHENPNHKGTCDLCGGPKTAASEVSRMSTQSTYGTQTDLQIIRWFDEEKRMTWFSLCRGNMRLATVSVGDYELICYPWEGNIYQILTEKFGRLGYTIPYEFWERLEGSPIVQGRA